MGIVSTVITLLLGCMCGHGLVRFGFPGRHAVAYTTLLLFTVPLAVLSLPVFMIWNGWKLVNSLWGLVLLNLSFTVWLPCGSLLQVPGRAELAGIVLVCARPG